MMLPFEYHPDAIAEAREVYAWYEAVSPAAAERFWEELVKARHAVAERPAAWTPYHHGTRCYPLRRFPFGLVYVERDCRIIGLAVCHLHRRPDYWRDRERDKRE